MYFQTSRNKLQSYSYHFTREFSLESSIPEPLSKIEILSLLAYTLQIIKVT